MDGDAPAAGGKADGVDPAAPVKPLSTGQSVEGQAMGSGVSMYVVDARPGSIVEVTVERSGGDLDPRAFLYRGLGSARAHDFMSPTHGFSNTADSIRAGWKLPTSFASELLLVVSAGGASSGDFTLELSCHPDSPVPCSSNGVEDELAACEFLREAFDRCVEDEEDCDDFLAIEDTTGDEECCELWQQQGEPLAEFCG